MSRPLESGVLLRLATGTMWFAWEVTVHETAGGRLLARFRGPFNEPSSLDPERLGRVGRKQTIRSLARLLARHGAIHLSGPARGCGIRGTGCAGWAVEYLAAHAVTEGESAWLLAPLTDATLLTLHAGFGTLFDDRLEGILDWLRDATWDDPSYRRLLADLEKRFGALSPATLGLYEEARAVEHEAAALARRQRTEAEAAERAALLARTRRKCEALRDPSRVRLPRMSSEELVTAAALPSLPVGRATSSALMSWCRSGAQGGWSVRAATVPPNRRVLEWIVGDSGDQQRCDRVMRALAADRRREAQRVFAALAATAERARSELAIGPTNMSAMAAGFWCGQRRLMGRLVHPATERAQ